MNDPNDVTWEGGIRYLRRNYPNGRMTFGTSSVTGNAWVKVDGSLALKEEKISEHGATLCNEFRQKTE